MDSQRKSLSQWVIAGLIVLLAAGAMVRLGVWQLERLRERRALNNSILAGMGQPAIDLAEGAPSDLSAMVYRQAVATGAYLEGESILLRNQVWEGETGYHLITPLKLAGTEELLLVDRGFLPLADGNTEALARYSEPGTITVQGEFRAFLPPPRFTGVPDAALAAGERRLSWNFLNIDLIRQQLSAPVLNAWLLASPEPDNPAVNTIREQPGEPDLSEGPHLGYALQWFGFAAVLLVMFSIYARKNYHKI